MLYRTIHLSQCGNVVIAYVMKFFYSHTKTFKNVLRVCKHSKRNTWTRRPCVWIEYFVGRSNFSGIKYFLFLLAQVWESRTAVWPNRCLALTSADTSSSEIGVNNKAIKSKWCDFLTDKQQVNFNFRINFNIVKLLFF